MKFLILSFLFSYFSCVATKPTKLFTLEFETPLDIQAALSKTDFLRIPGTGQTVKIDSITFVSHIFINGQWQKEFLGTSIAVDSIKQIYKGKYNIELMAVQDSTGIVLRNHSVLITVHFQY